MKNVGIGMNMFVVFMKVLMSVRMVVMGLKGVRRFVGCLGGLILGGNLILRMLRKFFILLKIIGLVMMLIRKYLGKYILGLR